jgi:hypothetical protein
MDKYNEGYNQCLTDMTKFFNDDYSLDRADDDYEDTTALDKIFIFMCSKGFTKNVNELIEKVDYTIKNNAAIKLAAENGHIEIVNLLLKKIGNINYIFDNYDLINVCENGHLEVVNLLLTDDRIDPTDYYNS